MTLPSGRDNGRGNRHDGQRDEDGPLVVWAQWVRAGILASLTPLEAKVAMTLVSFASREGKAFPAASKIAKLIGTRRTSVYIPLEKLVTLKIFERPGYVPRAAKQSRGPGIYQLLPPPSTTNRDVVPEIGTGVVPLTGTGVVPLTGTGVVPLTGTQIGSSYRHPEVNKEGGPVSLSLLGDGPKKGTGNETAGTDLIQWFGVDAPRIGLSLGCAMRTMKRGGVTDQEIEFALAEVERQRATKGHGTGAVADETNVIVPREVRP